MIITRTPLRISFVGGGSDVPSFYREEKGATVTAAINKYVYVTVSEKFDGSVRAAYREIEDVPNAMELHHDLIREGLMWHHLRHGVEVHSIADVPGGTGLGSSSAFAVGLLEALAPRYRREILAADAFVLETERCRHQVGKQDHYATAFGGVNLLQFKPSQVQVTPIPCDTDALSSHLLLLYTGQIRQGNAGQHIAAQRQDRDDIRQLAALAELFADDLRLGDLNGCGILMNMAWQIKSKYASNPQVDAWYAAAKDWGAWGGKLCGAGGGGFLAFLAPPERHAGIIQTLGLRHVPVRLGVDGTTIIYKG